MIYRAKIQRYNELISFVLKFFAFLELALDLYATDGWLGLWYSIFALSNRVRDVFIVSGSIQPLDLLDEAGTEPRPFFASEDPIHCATTYRRLFVNRHMSVRA